MITNRKKVGTVLGFVALTAAILTVAFWFRLADQVAIPEDRTLFVVAFLVAAGLGVALVDVQIVRALAGGDEPFVVGAEVEGTRHFAGGELADAF